MEVTAWGKQALLGRGSSMQKNELPFSGCVLITNGQEREGHLGKMPISWVKVWWYI